MANSYKEPPPITSSARQERDIYQQSVQMPGAKFWRQVTQSGAEGTTTGTFNWGNFTTTNIGANNDGGATGLSKFTRASGSFITDGYRTDDWITVAGFADASNNDDWKIKEVSALEVIVWDPNDDIGTEAAEAGQSMTATGGKMYRLGTKNIVIKDLHILMAPSTSNTDNYIEIEEDTADNDFASGTTILFKINPDGIHNTSGQSGPSNSFADLNIATNHAVRVTCSLKSGAIATEVMSVLVSVCADPNITYSGFDY